MDRRRFRFPAQVLLGAALAAGACGPAAANSSQAAKVPDPMLATVAERSGFRITGRYAEVESLCTAFAERWPEALRCHEFGRTPEGRPMLALVASRSGALEASEARELGVPVLLFQGGIHAGEIDGKDAGFLALRELLVGSVAPDALDKIVFVFVPVFNADGHERFGRWNRPNQNGPEEMGWRTTAQNLNLNRDYAKADAPEMRAMLRLLGEWDPILYVDLHATNGARFEHDIANLVEPRFTGDPQLRPAGEALLQELNAELSRHGSLPLDFYPSLQVQDDPASGFSHGAAPPRFSTSYRALHNRFAVLVETHSWKDYPTRVRATRNTIIALSRMGGTQGKDWLALAKAADARSRKLAGTELALDYAAGERAKTIDFRGYAYTREPSSISGALLTRYDPRTPQLWRVPLRDEVIASKTVRAPGGGYIVPRAHADWLGERLALHGIEFHPLARAYPDMPVEIFGASGISFGTAPFEGRMTAAIEGHWTSGSGEISAGSLFVPIAQPRARLVVALLEPQAPDSYAAWGFFNHHFEKKEYMENYVAEQVGLEMLASRPEVAAEFRRRLATDPSFAADPAARLEYFYRRHPSWDARYLQYPVYRVATPLQDAAN